MVAKIKKVSKSEPSKPKGVSTREFEKVHWPYLPVLLVLFFLLSLCVQTGSLQAFVRDPGGKVLSYATSMSVNSLLSSTNSARANNGIKTLSLNSKLNSAAQAKANDMVSRNYWSHNTPDGKSPWTFVIAKGYAYQKLGENLAAGFDSAQATVNGWMASAPHRANLLDSAFSNVGFGYANSSNYTSAGGGPMTVVVAFYGKPAASSSPTPSPVASSSPQSSSPQAAPPPASSPKKAKTKTPKAATKKDPQAQKEPAPESLTTEQITSTTPSANTEGANGGVTLALRTSRADVAFAKAPVTNFGTGIAIFILVASLGFWISRHAFAIRRALTRSETFVIRHPLMDIGLVMIAGLAYLLTQTAGFIR